MDPWPPYHTTDTTEQSYSSRVLASTSGNAQPYPTDPQNHHDFEKIGIRSESSNHNLVYPQSLPILGSNDKATLRDRSAVKERSTSKSKHLRPYLQHDAYQTYLKRKRKDIGKDGRPVWSTQVEESFQDALIHIPPMGRRKKTQYGKPYGRNELIAEWIFQDTGEKRGRKQVSSHIQTLSRYLRDVPEWRALTAISNDENEVDRADSGCNYYYESVADQVRLRRQLAHSSQRGSERETFRNLAAHLYQHSISALSFELWVGAPENITQSVHNYTRIANSHSCLPAVPLEDFDNWRDLFPDLELLLQSSADDTFDIVLVKSSFALMTEFPPSKSKLGLVLDLDFRSPVRDNIKALDDLQYWSSVNHMYLNGRPFKTIEHKEYQSGPVGIVKPFFEADWWASHFTKLTHKRKEAERTHDHSAIARADDYSRSLFRGLSIMQEIFACPLKEPNATIPRGRMAVLLWVFSQANKGQNGTASWQKIIRPPNRMAEESPLAPPDRISSSLPPLVLDTMMEDSFEDAIAESDACQQSLGVGTPLSSNVYETAANNTGFIPFHTTITEQDPKLYELSRTGFTPIFDNFAEHNQDSFSFGMPVEADTSFQSFNRTDTLSCDEFQVSNVFSDLDQGHDHKEAFSTSLAFRGHESAENNSLNREQSLANFDVRTHQMLQTQLGRENNDYRCSPEEDYVMVEADSQETNAGLINNADAESEDPSHMLASSNLVTLGPNSDEIAERRGSAHSRASIFHSPQLDRPRLMPHNSFAGIPSQGASLTNGLAYDQLHFDTPRGGDFAKLMAAQFSDSDNNLFGTVTYEVHEAQMFASGQEIHRPRSQPILPSNASPVVLREDVSNLLERRASLEAEVKVEAED